MTRPGRSRLARRWLLFLGGVAAAALIATATFGFGDAAARARLQVEREAEVTARALQRGWEQLRTRPWPGLDRPTLFAPEDPLRVAVPDRSIESEPGSDAQLQLVAARASALMGDLASAREHASRAAAESRSLGGEALLTLVHAHLQCGAEEALPAAFRSAAPSTSFDSTVGGVSGRLLALLAALPWLPEDLIQGEVEALLGASKAGSLALPAPRDFMENGPDGLEFRPDATWEALELIARERYAMADWADVFQRGPRRARVMVEAIEALMGPSVGAGWTARQSAPGEWWMARRTDSGLEAFATDARSLDGVLAADLPAESEFAVAAFGRPTGAEVLAGPLRLEGTGVALSITHPDLRALLGAAEQRVWVIRAGLIGLALMMLASAVAGARTLARSERLDLLRSTFVASVSHDLRTPIASIGLMAGNMASGYAVGSEDRYVDMIQAEAARLRRLVDDLLDFGRIERGLPPRLQPERVSVGGWLDGFEGAERARCHAADCALTVERTGLPETAQLDTGAIERALSNLVDNALKHGAASAITLRVDGGGSPGVLRFEVLDDGSGLPKGAITQDLFEPFQRAGETSGTGLGLAIVRGIALAHGGSVTLGPRRDGSGARAELTVTYGTGAAA